MDSLLYTHLINEYDNINKSSLNLSQDEMLKFIEHIKISLNNNVCEFSVENIKRLESNYNIKISHYENKNINGLVPTKVFDNVEFHNCGSFENALELIIKYCIEKPRQGKPTYIHKNSNGSFYAFCPLKNTRKKTKLKLTEELSSDLCTEGYKSMQIFWINNEDNLISL